MLREMVRGGGGGRNKNALDYWGENCMPNFTECIRSMHVLGWRRKTEVTFVPFLVIHFVG